MFRSERRLVFIETVAIGAYQKLDARMCKNNMCVKVTSPVRSSTDRGDVPAPLRYFNSVGSTGKKKPR